MGSGSERKSKDARSAEEKSLLVQCSNCQKRFEIPGKDLQGVQDGTKVPCPNCGGFIIIKLK